MSVRVLCDYMFAYTWLYAFTYAYLLFLVIAYGYLELHVGLPHLMYVKHIMVLSNTSNCLYVIYKALHVITCCFWLRFMIANSCVSLCISARCYVLLLLLLAYGCNMLLNIIYVPWCIHKSKDKRAYIYIFVCVVVLTYYYSLLCMITFYCV